MISYNKSIAAVFSAAVLSFSIPPARCRDDNHLSQLPAALADARFQAAFAVRNNVPSRHGSEIIRSFGEFTMQGPIASTLRPIAYSSRAHVVFTPDGVFADRWRVDSAGQHTDWINEVNGRSPHSMESVGAYDSKRKHVVCFDREYHWYRYDVENRRFIDRRKVSGRPTCMVYDSERDVMLGFSPRADGRSRMEIYSVDGELQDSLDLSIRLADPTQLCAVWHRGYVLLIWATTFTTGKPFEPGAIVALNAKNGEVVYRGAVRPLGDDGKPVVWSLPVVGGDEKDVAAEVEKTPRHEWWRRRLDALGDKLIQTDRDDIAERIDELREYENQDTPKSRTRPARIHGVSLQRSWRQGDLPFTVALKVTDIGRPLSLVLCADGPTRWQLHAEENVRLEHVYVLGFGSLTREVEGLPDGVQATYWQYGDHRMPYLSTDEATTFSSRTQAAFGARPATEQIVKPEGPGPWTIEIGSDNPEWRTQYLDALERDVESCIEIARLASRTFVAGMPHVERAAGVMRAIDDSSAMPKELVASRYGEFTTRGPTSQLVDSPDVRVAFAVDGEPGERYVADLNQVYRIDAATGKRAPLGRDGVIAFQSGDAPRPIGNICGIAFDSKRKELVAAFQYQWSPALYRWSSRERRWELISRLASSCSGLAYDARYDLFYSVGNFTQSYHRQQFAEVVVFTRFGALVALNNLSVPVGQNHYAGPPQLVLVEDRLVAITPTHERFGEPGVNASEIYIVDPLTGKTYFAGAFQVAAKETAKNEKPAREPK